MKKILFALCIGLLGLAAASCSNDDNDVKKDDKGNKYTVYGSVYDAKTGNPLKNATVFVCSDVKVKDSYGDFNNYDEYDEYVPELLLGSTVTGSDGNFVVTFTTDGLSELCYLMVGCDGYEGGQPVPFKPASDKKLDIPLMPKGLAEIEGPDDVIFSIGSANIMVYPRSLGPTTYSGALEACKNQTSGGYKDWRLPTLAEMMVIYDEKNNIEKATGQMFSTQEPYWTSDEIYTEKEGRLLFVMYMELQDYMFGGYDFDYVVNHKVEFLRGMAAPYDYCRLRPVRTITK